VEHIVIEAIEIELPSPYNIKRECGFSVSKSCKLLIGYLKLLGHDPRPLGDTIPIISLTLSLFSVTNPNSSSSEAMESRFVV
jgi:hypothetical protein